MAKGPLAFLEPLSSSLASRTQKYIYSGLALPNGSAECVQNCSCASENETQCVCPCPQSSELNFMAAFASISYLLFFIASIQLILCMVHDALQDEKQLLRWRNAFRATVHKCLLGAVVAATGTRAIYFTVQLYIPEEWADIILNLYYPALITALSLLICFWAEVFYHSLPPDGHDFLKKHKYFVALILFNILVYLLLVADVIATPLVKNEQEQARKSGIIGSIFAFFLLVTLVGFLHLAIRLFFRPDWRPLFFQIRVCKINLKQQAFSIAGIISNAVMQSLVISLLVFNMVSHFQQVDQYILYVGAIVIRVTELCIPVWFCCSLWNYRQPKRLWILNPSLLLQRLEQNVRGDTERGVLVESNSSTTSDYGTFSHTAEEDPSCREPLVSEEGCCWVCQDEGDPSDIFYPCKCRLHQKCLKEWVTTRVSNVNISRRDCFKCQVCGEQYRTKKHHCGCFPSIEKRYWLRVVLVLLILVLSTLAATCIGVFSDLHTNAKIAAICTIAVFNVVLLKISGFGLMWAYRRSKVKAVDIMGAPVPRRQGHQQHSVACSVRTGRDLARSYQVTFEVH